MLEIDKRDLKLISYDFRCKANAILQSDADDFISKLKIFLKYIDSQELICSYIKSTALDPKINIAQEIAAVVEGYEKTTFDLGETDEEQLAFIYCLLDHMKEKNLNPRVFLFSYTNSRNYDDMVKSFNNKVTLSLINLIIAYLTKIGIKMGYDEERKYLITINNGAGQVNISQDNSTLNAIQNNNPSINEIIDLSNEIKKLITPDIPTETQELLSENLDCLTSIIQTDNPKKSVIKTCLKGLKDSLSTITDCVDLTLKINSLIALVTPFTI